MGEACRLSKERFVRRSVHCFRRVHTAAGLCGPEFDLHNVLGSMCYIVLTFLAFGVFSLPMAVLF